MERWDPIDGETPIDDVSGLKVKGISTRAELNAVEGENIRKATVKYLAQRPSARKASFTVSWMLQLHREMFGDVWEWAGVQRKTQKNIGIAATSIALELKKLEGDAAYWTEHRPMEPVEIAARIHHRAVHIHPFENGNGRWARHLANIWLRREGQPLTMWPERTVGEASPLRDEYLDAIRTADDGNLEPLIALHRRHSQR